MTSQPSTVFVESTSASLVKRSFAPAFAVTNLTSAGVKRVLIGTMSAPNFQAAIVTSIHSMQLVSKRPMRSPLPIPFAARPAARLLVRVSSSFHVVSTPAYLMASSPGRHRARAAPAARATRAARIRAIRADFGGVERVRQRPRRAAQLALRRAFDQVLGFFEAQASDFAHGLDDGHLVGARLGQDDVEFGLLFDGSSGATTTRGDYAPMVNNSPPSHSQISNPRSPIPTAADPHAGHPAAKTPVNSLCAICGMKVDPSLPTTEYQGQTIGFGCKMCAPKFKAEPEKYGPSYLRNELIKR